MKKNRKRLTRAEQRRALAAKAMPEVKRLVARYDRAIIQTCLNRLRQYDAAKKALQLMEAKALELRRTLGR